MVFLPVKNSNKIGNNRARQIGLIINGWKPGDSMGNHIRITAIVGSYRKDGIIDTAIDEFLASAREEGAEVEKIYLIDKHIEFCTNCRTCTQQDGERRGQCVIAVPGGHCFH